MYNVVCTHPLLRIQCVQYTAPIVLCTSPLLDEDEYMTTDEGSDDEDDDDFIRPSRKCQYRKTLVTSEHKEQPSSLV